MAIRPNAVLTALSQRPHNGVLRTVGTDAAVKLLRSMGLRNGLIGELRERLHELSDRGEIVIDCEGNRFELIALPDALEDTVTDTKDVENPMIAPAGQRKTTYARDGEGRELPSHLGPQHVGPLTITYKDQVAGEGIAAAADLVYGELVKCSKLRYGRDELRAAVRAYLLPLYDDKSEVAEAMGAPVVSHLLGCGRAKRVPVPGRRNEFVIELVVVDPIDAEIGSPEVTVEAVPELDPIEVLTRLVPELEEARRRIIELEALVNSAISVEVVTELTERAEGLQAEKEELQRKLDAAAVEKTKILAGQRERLGKVRRDHESALATLREENARGLAAVRRELEATLQENNALKEQAAQRVMPEDLRRRVDKVLGK